MGSARPLRILVAGLSWPPETFLARLFKEFLALGAEVTVATAEEPGGAWFERPGFRWLYAPHWSGPPPVRLYRLARMSSRARRWRPVRSSLDAPSPTPGSRLQVLNRHLPFAAGEWDVAYIPWNLAAANYLPLMECVPTVLSCRGSHVNVAPHDPDRPEVAGALRATFERAAAVHCVSDAMLAEARRHGLEDSRAFVIPPAVDPEFFHPRRGAGRTASSFTVVTVGSLLWLKGHEYALLSIRQLRDRGVPVRFDIIGDGPERERVSFTIRDLGLEPHVRLLGRRPPVEVRDRLQRADAFLLSSVSEGISNAALEAMACGIPVVTSEAGGMAEAVTDGVEGLVVPLRDPSALAEALNRLHHSAELRARIGAAGRRRVVRDFDLGTAAESFFLRLRDVARMSGSPSGSEAAA